MTQLVREKEAIEYWDNIRDPITRSLVSFMVKELYQECRSEWPVSDLDFLFFLRVVARALSQHDVVEDILAGISQDWPAPE